MINECFRARSVEARTADEAGIASESISALDTRTRGVQSLAWTAEEDKGPQVGGENIAATRTVAGHCRARGHQRHIHADPRNTLGDQRQSLGSKRSRESGFCNVCLIWNFAR